VPPVEPGFVRGDAATGNANVTPLARKVQPRIGRVAALRLCQRRDQQKAAPTCAGAA